jgi:histidyl-tRNA synthetase
MASKPVSLKEQEIFHPEVAKRQYIIKIIKIILKWFSTHRNTIVWKFRNFNGKYGEEGDRLIFKILNFGILFAKVHLENRQYEVDTAFREKHCVMIWLFRLLTLYNIRTILNSFWYQSNLCGVTGLRRDVLEFFQCDADVVGLNRCGKK